MCVNGDGVFLLVYLGRSDDVNLDKCQSTLNSQ